MSERPTIPGTKPHAATSDDLAFWEGVKWVVGVNVIVTLVCLAIGHVLWRIL